MKELFIANVKATDKLALATKYLQKIQRYASSDLEVHLIACQLYLKKSTLFRLVFNNIREVPARFAITQESFCIVSQRPRTSQIQDPIP